MPNYGSSFGYSFRSSVTRWVRLLLIANAAVFLAFFLVGLIPPLREAARFAYVNLALSAGRVLFRPWTVVTYAFLHSGFFHFFFNMLGLFFFGPRLEDRWGSRAFLRFYLIAAAGGALFSLIDPGGFVVGASAAVNGLLLAWALYWPDEEVMFWGIFPIKIKWLVVGMGVVSVMSAAGGTQGGDGIAHLAHIGGFVTAFLYLKSRWAPPAWGELPARRKPKRQRAVVPWKGAARKEQHAAPVAPGPGSASAPRSARNERDLLDDVDRILDKISAQGLGSLTPEERARLDEVSRRYRTN
ncbi:MAG TPA: rhomboid family intramembrane serine protease [Longimicrobiaceae bacterium]|nr:rhomboid family intramembrane serine protease [Longimicrobiaceae bacterium]